jgi:hypothetical protein
MFMSISYRLYSYFIIIIQILFLEQVWMVV